MQVRAFRGSGAIRAAALLFLVAATGPTVLGQVDGYYRYPAAGNDRVVFTAEGDLWSVPLSGGSAHRITTHAGQEAFAVLSPDGRQVAFAGTYEGANEIYVMPVGGGLPKRITWDGSSSTRPVLWRENGRIVYTTRRYSTLPDAQLFEVDPETLERTQAPLQQAATAAYAPDGTLFFTRLPRQGSNSRWYKGGLAQSLWKFGPGDSVATALTDDWPGTSKDPVWFDGRIYFLSDRAGFGMNVWSMAPDGSDLRRHTSHTEWDVQEHTVAGGVVVYRLGADLWRLDLNSGESLPIPITLVSDADQRRETWEDNPARYLTSFALSPDGKRVALTARGELFVVPADTGRLVHVSRDSGVRHRFVTFAPDGDDLLSLSDASGEVDWWKLEADGVGRPQQVGRGPAMLRLEGTPSPDGKYLAYTDYDKRLWLLDLETGASEEVGASETLWTEREIDYAWSPDSRYLAYSTTGDIRLSRVYVYDLREKVSQPLTSDRYEDWSPTWSADGAWVYFLSDRAFVTEGNVWGARAEQPHFDRQTLVYAIPLREGAVWPFRAPDELHTPPDSAARAAGAFGEPGALRQAPLPRGNYAGLKANAKRLFFLATVPEASGGELRAIDLEHDAKPVTITKGVFGYQLSQDGKKLLVRKRSEFFVIDASAGAEAKLDDAKVDLSGWTFPVDKQAEWRQAFTDAWRLHRDYFYDPDMHGVDWEAVYEKYAPLVDRVGAREELADLQAQMVSELSLMHSNAGGGDTREGDDDVLPGSLGARFEKDAETGAFRVVHVYQSDPDRPDERAPLAHPDTRVGVGSAIVTVNGDSTVAAPDMGALLRGQAGKPVRLGVLDPQGGRREVIARAISMQQEYDLRYSEWEYTRRLKVEQDGAGAIGYVHLRAMGSGDMARWTRDFYPVFNRQGLVIDVRHNNGGNIDSWVLGQLLRRAWMYWKGRSGNPFWNMHSAFRGHMVVLVDEATASDGEAFAEGFRRLGLGEVFGTRTWGGEVWLSSSNRQVDDGIARASEGGVYGPEGAWLIEGWGVVPDVVVDNDPAETFRGRDAQLDAAVEHLKRLIAADPRPVPAPPPYPTVEPGVGYPVDQFR